MRFCQWMMVILTLGFSNLSLQAADESAIVAQLQPYSQGKPRVAGLEPGVTLAQTNAQLAKEVLPAEVLQLLEAGDFSLFIQETTDLPLRQSYIDATVKYSQQVSLNGGSALKNYQAGLPFPLVDPTDPQAGEKLAWNLRFRDMGETIELIPTMRQMTPSGGVEHMNRGLMQIRFGMYRPDATENDPQWQQQQVFMKTTFELFAPSDQEGIMRILIMYDDDRIASQQWRYTPQSRRARKDYMNYLTPIGGYYEALQEENAPLFFQGYIQDYQWKCLSAQIMLVPGFLKTTELHFGGKNNWYPQVPWELRRVYIVEATPTKPHPFGRRVYFLDQQSYVPLLFLTYTPAGAFVRLAITAHAHPDFHPGSNGTHLPVAVGATWINYAKDRATLFTAEDSLVYNRPLTARRFELMEILRRGK